MPLLPPSALLVRDVDGQYRPASADEVLHQARRLLSKRVRRGATMSSPQAVKDYLRLQVGVMEHEVFCVVFCVVFLDAQHRLIALKEMFRGTVTQTSVYPREVVKESLALNAAAVILAHNHAESASACGPRQSHGHFLLCDSASPDIQLDLFHLTARYFGPENARLRAL